MIKKTKQAIKKPKRTTIIVSGNLGKDIVRLAKAEGKSPSGYMDKVVRQYLGLDRKLPKKKVRS